MAGASAVAMLNGKLQADLLFLGDIIALHATDVFSKYPLIVPFRMKNPQKVRDAFCILWIGVSGPPMCIRMDELWVELSSGLRI